VSGCVSVVQHQQNISVCYVMVKTSNLFINWWCSLFWTRPTRWVIFLQC